MNSCLEEGDWRKRREKTKPLELGMEVSYSYLTDKHLPYYNRRQGLRGALKRKTEETQSA